MGMMIPSPRGFVKTRNFSQKISRSLTLQKSQHEACMNNTEKPSAKMRMGQGEN